MFSGCIAAWGVQRSDARGNRHHGHVGDSALFTVSRALIFSWIELSIASAPPFGELRRVACSGSIGQRSGAVLSIAEIAL